MARRRVSRDLPPLAQAFADFTGFPPEANRQALLEEHLRAAVGRLRRTRPRTFYALRDVAAFFRVPLRSVARAYERLRGEGRLVTIRSSSTEIPSRHSQARSTVRGIVGIPIWLPGFLLYSEWRTFFTTLEEELRHQSFVANFIFYSQGQEIRRSFLRGILRRSLDFLIWFCPAEADRNTVGMISDAGLRVVVIDALASPFPALYRLDRTAALTQGLREWREAGLSLALVPCPSSAHIPRQPDELETLLRAQGFGVRYAPGGRVKPETYLETLAVRPDEGLVFERDYWYVQLCRRQPERLANVMRSARCMIFRSEMPQALKGVGSPTQLISYDHRDMAVAIVRDLSQEKLPAPDAPGRFNAEWHTPARTKLLSFQGK
ncbi:MAG: hypothetical protein HS116_00520 [Planctomycetes bacterium]|nr:hypothetical protein [Planctomycetota bacterium]